MKLNERSLAFYATCDSPADNTGFLFKKGERNPAYHRRWFVLKGNMLFYFEARESREPVGVIILEGCTVELCEAAEEFAFAIKFDGAKSRAYLLAAESQASLETWVKSLSRASFNYLRLVVKELEKQLKETQWELAGGRSVPKRSPVYRKTKPAHGLDAPAPALELPPPRERPVVPPGALTKENSCAVWNNAECADTLPAGDAPGGLAESGSARTTAGDRHQGSLKPPPLPPRRQAWSGNASGTGVLAAESPGFPGPACFSKLHESYGRAITELRREWLEKSRKL
ncbi:sesquipedalian-1 [Emydura macquarii macquarii]|uniref:sesquipedalian-1 n=1 Tax=Emydura macquarii macquarii TaxID=1129001 RepID=UPI00352B1B9E